MFFIPIFVLLLLVSGIFALITWQNLDTLTHLNFYFWKTPAFPVGLLFIASVLLGAIFIFLVAWLAAIRDRREVKRLRKRVEELEALQKQQQQQQSTPAAPQSSGFFRTPPGMPPHPSSPAPLKMPGMTGPLSIPPGQ